MGIGWMDWKGEKKLRKEKHFYKNLLLWITGFLLMNLYGIPSAVALKQLPSHIVAAFAGWGIVLLVFLSHWLLKEKLYRSDFIFSLLIVAGICVLNLFEKAATKSPVNYTGLTIMLAFPVGLFIGGVVTPLPIKIRIMVLAAVCGITAGVMVVALKLLVQGYNYQVALYFHSLYFYIYIAAALLSFVALQMACKKGSMMIIGPVQYSMTIIYPVAAAVWVFGRPIPAIQLLAVGVIIYSVFSILKKH